MSQTLRDYGIDKYQQPNSALNFSSRYNFSNGFSIGVDCSNLLDNWTTYDTKGLSPGYQKDYIEPGRTILVKTSFTL